MNSSRAPTIYKVKPYPDPRFQPDEPAQTEIKDYARRKDDKLKRAYLGSAAAFTLSIVFGFAHIRLCTLTCLAAFAALVIYGLIVMFRTHKDQTCSKCKRPLETVWPVTSDGFASEYRICRHCGLYRYMFRTSRQ